jgi:hypothetical protein
MVNPHEIIETLQEIVVNLQHFSNLTANELHQVELAISSLQERLQQRQIELKRDYQEANDALNQCLNSDNRESNGDYHTPDCSAYQQGVYELEQDLSKLYRLTDMLNEASNRYRAKANQLSAVVDTRIPATAYWLRNRQQALEEFEQNTNFAASPVSRHSQSHTAGTSQMAYKREDHGIVNITVSDLPEPDLKGEKDFKKVSVDDMRNGLAKLQTIQASMQEGRGIDADYWSQIDEQEGLSYQDGYRNIYDAFYGESHVHIEKVDGKYDIINGRHRVWLAKRMGITHLPARVIELSKEDESS